jgi:hypothetical protein
MLRQTSSGLGNHEEKSVKILKKARARTPGEVAVQFVKKLDYVVELMVGGGLAVFKLVDGKKGKVFILGMDCEASGRLGANYLSSILLLMTRWDPFHNLWNQTKNGIKQANLWGCWIAS